MILEHRHEKKGGSLQFIALLCILVGLAFYMYQGLRSAEEAYANAQAVSEASSKSAPQKFTLGGTDHPLYLPEPSLLKQGDIWGLVSRDHPLPENYTPAELVNVSVAHGDANQDMKVQKRIESPLKALFAAAEADGIELMLSSAYRSIPDQIKLYDAFVAEEGQEMADIYVAKPGTSEHHTGLAVDMSSASPECEMDSDKCSLSQAATAWLAENAPKFGFVLRYPEGKRAITGVGFEPWHYRYVGVVLAQAVSASGLTLDEVIEEVAPGLKPRD